MNIGKAIEILIDLLGEGPQFQPDDRREAVKLGIDAMKRLQEARKKVYFTSHTLLPGETEK